MCGCKKKLLNFGDVVEIRNMSKILKLPTLRYRRARGDMNEVFKILHGHYDNIDNITLTPHVGVATRGNKYKLCLSYVK